MVKFGRIARAENNLGGTRALYVLIGFVVMVLGLLVLFGLVDLSSDPNTITLQGGI